MSEKRINLQNINYMTELGVHSINYMSEKEFIHWLIGYIDGINVNNEVPELTHIKQKLNYLKDDSTATKTLLKG